MKKKLLAGLATGIFLFGMAQMANATIINFDDIGTPSAYGDVGTTHDFTFSSNMDWVDISATSQFSQYGPAVSGDFAALNNNFGTGTVVESSSDIFSFDGMYTKSFLNSTVGDTVWIYGYNSGTLVESHSFVQTLDWQYISVNMTGLDQLELALGDNFWIDDIAFNEAAPVPEPATMLLFGTGLVGLVGSRLRKKKK